MEENTPLQQGAQLLDNEGFNGILLKAVDIALTETMGDSGGRALRFYLDPSVLLKDPELYSLQLRKIFSGSEAGAQMIEKRISTILTKLVLQRIGSGKIQETADKETQDFRTSIEECKKEFLLT
jgi:hypothetical protein